jgi:DNA-binding HxlR family transcriptional regulator
MTESLSQFIEERDGRRTGEAAVPRGMQNYRQYCPVARASEILADRWTPLIVRELILGSHRFNEIERGLPGISRSLLSSRLRDLEDAGVVERLPRCATEGFGVSPF